MIPSSRSRKKQRDNMRDQGLEPINNGYIHPDDKEKLAKYINSNRVRGYYKPKVKKESE
jgi:hypothetical protein